MSARRSWTSPGPVICRLRGVPLVGRGRQSERVTVRGGVDAAGLGAGRPDRGLDAARRRHEEGAEQVGATRLGFALLLKSFEVEARFPESAKEMPAAVEYVAQQVKFPAGAWADYDWQGDRIKRHARRSGRHTGLGRTPRRTRSG
ncbi:DUF4158 domain-containing protein [Streptomyces sp. NPDC020766]